MAIILTLLCRNEVDVIAATVEFHLRCGVDFILATDNGSTDGTVDVLSDYERRGVLRLLHEPVHIHDQAVWVSRMAHLAFVDHGADWVIPCDADEFWWPSSGSLANELAAVPQDVMALAVGRVNFLPPASGLLDQVPFHQAQIIRERESLNSLGAKLPPKVCHRGHAGVTVSDGNHAAFLNGEYLAARQFDGLQILHFPVRSYAQYERKIRDGAEALARNPRLSPEVGSTWRRLYHEQLCAGTLPDYYMRLRPESQALAEALASGELVEDRRVQQVLADWSLP